MDLEVWSQWSMPGMLLERWGELEQFVLECGPQKVCSEYNLLILRLLDGGGLLRLHANFPTTDWEANFIRWSDHSNPQSVRNLCDLLIGSALGINTYSVTCSQGLLSVQLSKLTDSSKWISFVRDILLSCPSSLLGCLFTKIILPCVDEVGYRSINSWPLDAPDLPTTLTNSSPSGILPLLRDAVLPTLTNAQDLVLISAIGSLGLQLNWSAFVSYFEEHRLRLRGTRALETDLPPTQNEVFLERLMITSSPVRFLLAPALYAFHNFSDVLLQDRFFNSVPSILVLFTFWTHCRPSDLFITSAFQPTPSVPVTETTTTQSNVEPDHPVYCDSNQTDRESFITTLRRREFGCGAELSTEAVDLIRFHRSTTQAFSLLMQQVVCRYTKQLPPYLRLAISRFACSLMSDDISSQDSGNNV
ncbi:hypothetical protein PHET_11741 [Paragonimus heterotremus]|uniref:Uncharacterized protein n=1 Tax=Paragonimus heterotremus TaxID=100268 RepID=A0A8J4WDH7_9TREM|nr:hypothetical protein PHET_11741 [Paragonimus heterotremus]